MTKRVFQLLVVIAVLVASFGSAGSVFAGSNCGSSITVQWGDTLSGIALLCGTTVNAIRAANPGLGWWVYAGQVLYIPIGNTPPVQPPASSGTYVVQWGDTMAKIAGRVGCTLGSLLAANPQISNPSLIFAGQVINLPAGAKPPTPPLPSCNCQPNPPSDSLTTLKVAYQYGLYIRSEPGGKIISSALDKDVLYYRTNSVFTDQKGKVWVEVRLNPPVKGYYIGWLLVKDQFGKYFTEPHIDP